MNCTFGKIVRILSTLFVGVVCVLAWASRVEAQPVTGAIFTTFWDTTKTPPKPPYWDVDHNIYPDKPSVFLSGGPPKGNDPGLGPDGDYYFQVTNPGGDVLLSTDPIACRQVTVLGGRITGVVAAGGCQHELATQLLSTDQPPGPLPPDSNGNIPVQLIPFNDTPNPGGEYKAWMTPVALYDATGTQCWSKDEGGANLGEHGFCHDYSKTDNFKVKIPGAAYIQACKFWDHDGNGVRDEDTEELLPDWDINGAFYYGAGNNHNYLETRKTSADGCTTFTVLPLDGAYPSVSLSETLKSGWIQTAPIPTTATVTPDPDNDQTVYFGNYNLYEDNAIKVSKSVQPSVKYKWTIDKVATETEIDSATATATFHYTVSVSHDAGTPRLSGTITVDNGLSVDVGGLKLTDDAHNSSTCNLASMDADPNNFSVPAGGTKTFHYRCSFAGDVSYGENTVVLKDQSDTEIDTYSIVYDFKLADVIDGQIEVKDPNAPSSPLGTVDILGDNPTEFKYSIDWTGTPGTCKTFDNTATFKTTGTGATGATGSDTETVKLCVGADLQVSKTATPTFTRTYKWTIKKAVDKSLVEQNGGSATFNYTVDVAPDSPAYVDSGWQVTGKITVSNPNDWEDITLTDVVDSINNGGSCSITSGSKTATVNRNSSVTLGYTCTYATAPNPANFTNTATAYWAKTAAATPNESAAGTVDGSFGAPTSEANKTVTVTDNFNGTVTTLGPVTYPNSGHFTYSHTIPAPSAGTCASYPNTATIVETSQTAKQSVEICNTNTGGLTMGFWQNPNGQGIIKTSCGGTSGTSLFDFLAGTKPGYNPFKDLTKTACNDIAAYVTTVIKAATCSGPSSAPCNAMLKAQMLATALDVYFSDPALGGNKIGQYSGLNSGQPAIGGINIDLTKVCTMIDGSGGGTCSGTYRSVAAAFGGATCKSVSDMLSYAASQSNSGGSDWYGDLKATQVLAKDAFDAINNKVAYICP